MSLSFVASQIICIFTEFFTSGITKYNLICGSGLNVMHNTFLHLITHMWFNQLPVITKSSPTSAQFHSQLNDIKFIRCQCMNCVNLICLCTIKNLNLWPYSSHIQFLSILILELFINNCNLLLYRSRYMYSS